MAEWLNGGVEDLLRSAILPFHQSSLFSCQARRSWLKYFARTFATFGATTAAQYGWDPFRPK
jgi:hypothetical protein